MSQSVFAKISKMVRPAVCQGDRARLMSGEGSPAGFPGSGAGRGGGGGGSIRDAGGAFGKMEAAHEDQFFYNESKEKLHELHFMQVHQLQEDQERENEKKIDKKTTKK